MKLEQVTELQKQIQKALDGIKTPGQKYAFSVYDLTHASDTVATFTLRIDDVKQLSEMGEVFKQQAKAHGLDPEDLNQSYWIKGKSYRVIGANWNDQKFPVIVINEHNNKQFGLRLDAVIQAKKEALETRARIAAMEATRPGKAA